MVPEAQACLSPWACGFRPPPWWQATPILPPSVGSHKIHASLLTFSSPKADNHEGGGKGTKCFGTDNEKKKGETKRKKKQPSTPEAAPRPPLQVLSQFGRILHSQLGSTHT